jgi:hypothetical protein
VVTINAPNHNAQYYTDDTITLSGTATDSEDGDLSNNIIWNSTLEGYLGQGSSISMVLIEGVHTITAQVKDSENASNSYTILINIIAPEEPPTDPTPPPAANNPPTLTIYQPYSEMQVYFGQDVVFNGSAEDAEDGDISNQILWHSNLDGYFGTGANLVYQLSEGSHVITVKVTDVGNLTDTKTLLLEIIEEEQSDPDPTPPPVSNNPPTLNISTLFEGNNFRVDQHIGLSGNAYDVEDGDISQYISWESNIDGYIGLGAELSVSLSPGLHIITAKVSDSEDLTAVQTLSFTVYEEEAPPSDTFTRIQNIYISNIERQYINLGNTIGEKIDVVAAITVKVDANHNGIKDAADITLKKASVTISIVNSEGNSWVYSGKTKSNGKVEFTLGRVPHDRYEIIVENISHNDYDSFNPTFGNETVSANYYLR